MGVDWVAQRRSPGSPDGRLAIGRGVTLGQASCVRQSEFFAAVDLREGLKPGVALVSLAIGLNRTVLESALRPRFETRASLMQQEPEGSLWSIDETRLGALVFQTGQRRRPTPDEASDYWKSWLAQRWSEVTRQQESIGAWLARWNLWRAHHSLEEFEHVDSLLQAALAPHLTCVRDLWDGSWQTQLDHALPEDVRRRLLREAPLSWQAPDGRIVPIVYSEAQGATVSVRIQSVLGLKKQPAIPLGPLTLILLAPNNRPTQTTRDLPGFWQGSYQTVRRELKARYPKHAWPEDPMALTGNPRLEKVRKT
jgi:ATP-dependent helicase HrpB